MANILYRVGVYDILENAQKVCTTWRKICKDPAMWRVISMDTHGDPHTRHPLRKMCKHAVDRSQGQLRDLAIIDFVDYELLEYVAE
ncbi:putative F-box/LRR-repeat protein 23, partial [Tanacetum coccineum]